MRQGEVVKKLICFWWERNLREGVTHRNTEGSNKDESKEQRVGEKKKKKMLI